MRVANEVRVGVVVVLALALIVVGYFYLRGIGLGADLYYLRLNGAANIAVGNDVRLQGVKVGEVHDVTLDATTQKPLLTLAVRRDHRFKLMRNYNYSVQASSLIGENYVDIRGLYDESSGNYTPNNSAQVILGKAPAGIAGLTDQAGAIAEDFRKTLSKFNVTLERVNKGVLSYQNQIKLTQALDGLTRLTQKAGQGFGSQGVKIAFGDPTSQRSLNQALSNAALAAQEANVAAHNINGLTRSMNGVLGENRAELKTLLVNLSHASTNLAGLTSSLDNVMQKGGLQENLQLSMRSLRRTAENFEAGSANFKTIAGDPALQTSLKTTLQTLQDTTITLRDTATSVKGMLSDPAMQGQLKTILGTLSTTATTLQTATENLRDTSVGFKNVFGDTQFQNTIKGLPNQLSTTLTEAQGTMTAARSVAERVNSLLGGRKNRNSPEQAGGVKAQQRGYAPGGVDFTYRHFLDSPSGLHLGRDLDGRNFGDLTFNAEFFGGPVRLGLANIGEGTSLTAQTGSFIGKNGAVRYGVYRSKLGLGADYHFGKFSLEGNLWDPNHSSANAYLGYKITPRLEVLAGREHIRGVHTNSIGVRLTP